MGVEGIKHNQEDICGNDGVPYFSDRNLDIPQGIRFHISGIHNEATQEQIALKANIVENFIRSSINVDSGNPEFNSYIYDEIYSHLHTGVSESSGTLEDIDFPDFVLRDIFTSALKLYATEAPDNFSLYHSNETHEVTFGSTNVDISLLVNHIFDNSFSQQITELTGGESGAVSLDSLLEGFQERVYTRDQIMNLLEGEDGFQEDRNNGFSFSNALELFGFGERLEHDINIIFGRELTRDEIGNLINMTRYFLYVESSGGYNVSNYEGISTAKGYYQYLTGNGRAYREVKENDRWVRQGTWSQDDREQQGVVRRFWGTNSYETALGNIPERIVSTRSVFSAEIEKIGRPQAQDPRDLTADEQTILFLSDLLKRPGASNLIPSMLGGDIEAVEGLYRLHHTATDEPTEFRMLLAARDIYGIEIETYTRSPSGVIGLVLPEVNITNFFSGLIREINPNTSMTRTEIMQQLDALGNISFQAGSRIEIIRSLEDGVAYTLTLNGNDYIQINADKSFVYLG